MNKYFPHLSKKVSAYPFMDKIKGVVTEEWRKVDKGLITYNQFLKLYPLAKADAQLFYSIPTVNALVMRLARNTTLPLEEAVSFIRQWGEPSSQQWLCIPFPGPPECGQII